MRTEPYYVFTSDPQPVWDEAMAARCKDPEAPGHRALYAVHGISYEDNEIMSAAAERWICELCDRPFRGLTEKGGPDAWDLIINGCTVDVKWNWREFATADLCKKEDQPWCDLYVLVCGITPEEFKSRGPLSIDKMVISGWQNRLHFPPDTAPELPYPGYKIPMAELLDFGQLRARAIMTTARDLDDPRYEALTVRS